MPIQASRSDPSVYPRWFEILWIRVFLSGYFASSEGYPYAFYGDTQDAVRMEIKQYG
jgi:hypothetical protein